MGGLLDYNGPLMRTINKIADVAMLSFFWFVFCIPIVTSGAATTALYHTAYKVIRKERSHVWREFWSAFKSNFKQATIAELVMFLLYAFLGVVCYLYYSIGVLKFGIAVIIYLAIVLMVTMWGIYLFPYIARFQNTMKGVFMNAAYMCSRHIFRTVALFFIFLMAIVLFLAMPLLILVVPVGCAVVQSFILEKIFKKYMTEEDLTKEEEREKCEEQRI